MRYVQLVGVALAVLLLAAHFSRAGFSVLVFVCLALLVLLPVRRPWAGRALQVALALGALEWLRTATFLARLRFEAGMPYQRMLLILGAVAVFTGLMALGFQGRSLRRHYRLGQSRPPQEESPAAESGDGP